MLLQVREAFTLGLCSRTAETSREHYLVFFGALDAHVCMCNSCTCTLNFPRAVKKGVSTEKEEKKMFWPSE